MKPYVFSILPPGSVPSSQIDGQSSQTGSPTFIPSCVLEIRSSISLLPSQTIPLPFAPPPTSTSTATTQTNYAARLLTTSPTAKSPLFLITTPTDRTNATAEGSSIWAVEMKPWGEQVDELVAVGSYADALALLNSIDITLLPDRVSKGPLHVCIPILLTGPLSIGLPYPNRPRPSRRFPIPLRSIR